MTQKTRTLVNTLLVLLTIVLALVATLRLYPLIYHFDTVAISTQIQDRPQSSGKTFDAVLLDEIQAFSYIKSFDHVLEQGAKTHRVRKPFFIDRCEVSQNDFRVFANWLKLKPEKIKDLKAPGQPLDWKYESNTKQHAISGKLTAPANGITYYDAFAYCRAVGGRLPDQYEWIAAASGKAGNLYPWGNTFRLDVLKYLDPLLNAAQKCGVHPDNATPDKIYDMAGNNVSEWTMRYESPRQAAIVGGNAYNQPREIYNLNVLYRLAPPTYRSPYVGFRCVYDRKVARTPWQKKIQSAKVPAGQYAVGIPADSRIPNFLLKVPRDQIDTITKIFSRPETGSKALLYVMKKEVTRKQYQHFLNDPFARLKLYADENEPKGHRYQPHNWKRQLRNADLPVVNLDWWSAYAFSRWAGGRLPTAEEWSIVASDLGKHLYPWGNNPNPKQVTRRLQRAKLNPVDKTEHGVFDMGGNVSEWTQSIANKDGKYTIVTKGGNYLLPYKETARVDFSNFVSPHYESPTLGLRLVFDHPR